MRSVLKHSDIVLATFTMMNVILATLLVPAWGRLLIEPINKTVPRLFSPLLVTTHSHTRIHACYNSHLQFWDPWPPRYNAPRVSSWLYAGCINANPREGVPRNSRCFPIFVSTSPTAVAITILRVLITVLAHLPRNEFRRGLEGRWLRNP